MKFKNGAIKEIGVDVLIEPDGCAVIQVNGIGILRLTDHGTVARITNASSDVEKLKAFGFCMEGRTVEMNR